MYENTNSEFTDNWDNRDILFLHGQESGPVGSKYIALLEAFPYRVYAPDFQEEGVKEGMDIMERLKKLERITRGRRNLYLVGSSYGGLLAALFADAKPERVKGMLLLVPAVSLPEAQDVFISPANTLMIASLKDEYIPAESIVAYAAKHGIETHFVNDGHRLLNSNDKMVKYLKRIIG